MTVHDEPHVRHVRHVRRVRLVRLVAVAAVLATAAFAPARYPAPDGYVVDEADVLSASVEERLERELADVEADTGAEVAVAVVQSLDGATVETYANELFNTWGIGSAERNDGALLLIAVGDRRVRIEVGDGLRDRLTDAETAAVVNAEVVPRLRSGDYDGAVGAGTLGIRRTIGAGSATPDSGAGGVVPLASGRPDDFGRALPAVGTRPDTDSSFAGFAVAAGALALLGIGAAAVFRGGSSDRCPSCGTGLALVQPDHDVEGHRVYRDRCSSCGFDRVRTGVGVTSLFAPSVLADRDREDRRSFWSGWSSSSSSSWGSSDSSSSSSSSSSFSSSSSSSFGGGSSSGGGASGSW